MEPTTPPPGSTTSASESADAAPPLGPLPPPPLTGANEQGTSTGSAPARTVSVQSTNHGQTTLCSGERSDLARARVRLDFAHALSSDSYAWLSRALDEHLAQTLGRGQTFDCGPLARCYEPHEPPSRGALLDLAREPLPSGSLDYRSRSVRWSERYELAVVALGARAPRSASPRASESAHAAAWKSAIAGALPSFGALVALASTDASLVALHPLGSSKAAPPSDAALSERATESAREQHSEVGTIGPPSPAQRRTALIRTVTADDDERALVFFAPPAGSQRRALARAVRALASGTSATIRQTPGGLLQLTFLGAPEVTLAHLERLSANFARLTSASATLDDAPEGAPGEEAPLDRTCDALLGGTHSPPSSTRALDALRDAAILTVLERHASEKPKDGAPLPVERDLTGPLAALDFTGRALLVGPGDHVLPQSN